MLEYLRIALERSDEIDTEDSGELQKDFENFKSSLDTESKLTIVYDKGEDFEDDFEITFQGGVHSVSDESIGSIPAFFPVQIFSRSQIEAMANDPAKQRVILDAPIATELTTLRSQERDAISKIQALNTKIASARELEMERGTIISEIRNLTGQINSIEKHLGPLKEWLEWKAAKSKLTLADSELSEVLDEVEILFPKDDHEFEHQDTGTDAVKSVNKEIEKISELADQFASGLK